MQKSQDTFKHGSNFYFSFLFLYPNSPHGTHHLAVWKEPVTHGLLYSLFNQSELLYRVYLEELVFSYRRSLDLLFHYIILLFYYIKMQDTLSGEEIGSTFPRNSICGIFLSLYFGKVLFGMFFLTREKFIACAKFWGYNFSLFTDVLQNKCSWKFHKIHRKSPVLKSQFE